MSGPSLRAGDVVRIRDESWIVVRCLPGASGAILDVRGRDRSNLGLRTSFLLPCEPIERLPMSCAPRIVRPRTWRRLARAMLATSTSSYDALRSPVRANLTILPFQLEPALACVRGLAARILIADEVGLGKTIQAGLLISELLERRPGGRALVVSPAGLREQWQSELRMRFAIEAVVLDSATLARHAGTWNVNPWSAHPVVITSLDYVKRPEVARSLESLVWDVVVFDEAHALSGRSDRATVAAALAQRARTLVLLTATPHSGDDEAFARLCSIGDLSHQFPLLVFRRTRADAGLASSRRTTSLRVRPTPAELEMHRALMSYAQLVWNQKSAPSVLAGRLAVTVLMRRASSSAASLARSVERRLRLLAGSERPGLLQMVLPFGHLADEDEEPSTELTSPGLDDRDEECRWLERILQLARLAERGESKLRALARLLQRTAESAIVFTEYRDTLERLAFALRGFDPVRLHGGLTSAERHEVLQQFTAGGTRLLLATDAASEGLNLHQRCRLVINLELPWTPVRLEQRIGRVERLGQARRVHAIHLLARDTCEERSVAALLVRLRRVAEVLGGMRGAAALEHQVAAVAIGQDPVPDLVDSAPPSLPRGLVHLDLRAAARAEASRLETARRLAQGAGNEQPDGRPFVTLLTRGSRRRFCWAFQLVFEDLQQQRIWDTLLGIAGTGAPAPVFAKGVRSWVQSSADLVTPVLMAEGERATAALSASLHTPSELASRREHAIATTLEAQLARLSAALLQPGLFDRRAERASIAQRAVLDEALARSATRVEELARLERIDIARPALAFGVIRR